MKREDSSAGASQRVLKSIRQESVLLLALVIVGLASSVETAQNWKATVAGQSKDMSKQAVAFLPNELWIHQGDTITWTFASDDAHTVTFLRVGQTYPFDFTQGCPPISPSGFIFRWLRLRLQCNFQHRPDVCGALCQAGQL